MWILVAAIIDGNSYAVRADNYLYRSYQSCQESANSVYQYLVAAKRSPDEEILVYCTEVPKGI